MSDNKHLGSSFDSIFTEEELKEIEKRAKEEKVFPVKMSKSLGNVIAPLPLIKKYGLDAVRFYFLYNGPESNDAVFSEETLIETYNTMLANEYGNLVQRVLSLIYKNFPISNNPFAYIPPHEEFTENDQDLMSSLNLESRSLLSTYMDSFLFRKYIDGIWEVIRKSNQYMEKQKPWSLKNTDFNRMGTVLYVLLETIKRISIFTQPILPIGSEKILYRLGFEDRSMNFEEIEKPLIPNKILQINLEPVYPRLEKKELK